MTTCRRCHRNPTVKPWPPLCAACLAAREREDRALAEAQPRIESGRRSVSKPADCDHCGVPLAAGEERHWCGECRGTACGKCRDAIKGVTERAGCWVAERREKKAEKPGSIA